MTDIDYWSKLKLDECWSKKERFNIMMTYLMSETGNGEGLVEEEELSIVHVTVKDNDSEPIENANVIIHNSGTNQDYEGTTDKAGGCNIRDVPYGEYSIRVVAEGYTESEDTLTVDSDEINTEITLNVSQSFTIETPQFEETEPSEF